MAIKSSETTADWWPPGFRFHPTDEELILYWLKRKICRKRCKLDIVGEVDVYKCEPEELPGLSLLKTGDRQWFFFSPRDRKYPNGSRSNRGTKHGYWKATGKDRNITSSDRTVGIKKTLVFYKGRAPNGERTDWVMHEYTLDENELKRCESIQDYYALYKVFKKSGPGPKNGEQYGAPFKEEDWVDDDQPELGKTDPTTHVTQSNVSSADCCNAEKQADFTWTDIEECMKRLADEPLPEGTVVDHNAVALPQVRGEEESCVSDMSFARAAYFDPQVSCPPFTQHNMEGDVNCTFSTTSQFPLHDATQMPSDVTNLNRHVAEDDFLEMDDLLAMEPVGDVADFLDPELSDGKYLEPQPLCSQIQENLSWPDFDGLSEDDLRQEFFRNTGPSNEATTNGLSFMAAQVRQPPNLTFFEEETPSYDHLYNRLGNEAESCRQEDASVSGAAFQTPELATQSNPGVVFGGGNFTPNAMELHETKNGSGKGVEGAENWYTSALWSFVESIPTTPASAADSALINKALGRMSSFSRLRLMNAESTLTATPATCSATSNSSTTVSSSFRSGSDGGGGGGVSTTSSHGAVRKESGGRMKGFFLLSLLGVLFAVLFMFSRFS